MHTQQTIAYVYNSTNHVIATITGASNRAIEEHYNKIYGGSDDLAMTYMPAFGANDGLRWPAKRSNVVVWDVTPLCGAV